jgi:hypothetical protein
MERTRGDHWQAPKAFFSNPSILCIAVGGAANPVKGNYVCTSRFCHECSGVRASMTAQAYGHMLMTDLSFVSRLGLDIREIGRHLERMSRLVDRVDAWYDEYGWMTGRGNLVNWVEAFEAGDFPTLPEVYAGMKLEKDPAEKLHKGVEIFRELAQADVDPWGVIPLDRVPTATVYAEMTRGKYAMKIVKAVERLSKIPTRWHTTLGDRRVACFDRLEGMEISSGWNLPLLGADVVAEFETRDWPPSTNPRVTIHSHNATLERAQLQLNILEGSWYLDDDKDYLSSPGGGTKLDQDLIVKILRHVL